MFTKEVSAEEWLVKWLFVLDILKRQGKVYMVVVPDTKANTPMPIIFSKIKPDSVIYTDSWPHIMPWMYDFSMSELTI